MDSTSDREKKKRADMDDLKEKKKKIIQLKLEKRTDVFFSDLEEWCKMKNIYNDQVLVLLFLYPANKLRELIDLTTRMREVLERGSMETLKKLAVKVEKKFHGQYMGMKYAAARVLQNGGWTDENIENLYEWWKEICEDENEITTFPEPYVCLKPHEDLSQFLNTFFSKGSEAEDFCYAKIFDDDYKDMKNCGTQVDASDLLEISFCTLFEKKVNIDSDSAAQGPDPNVSNAICNSAEPTREEHEYLFAERTGMNEVTTSVDFPEPLKKIELQVHVFRYRNWYAEFEIKERNASISSTLCSDSYSDEEDDSYVTLEGADYFW